MIDCTSTGYNLRRFNQGKLRKVIHEYLPNLKLDQIIDLGKLPEDMPLSNIIVEMNISWIMQLVSTKRMIKVRQILPLAGDQEIMVLGRRR